MEQNKHIYINIDFEHDEKNGYWSHIEVCSDTGKEPIPHDALEEVFDAVDKLEKQLNNPDSEELPVYHVLRSSIIKNKDNNETDRT